MIVWHALTEEGRGNGVPLAICFTRPGSLDFELHRVWKCSPRPSLTRSGRATQLLFAADAAPVRLPCSPLPWRFGVYKLQIRNHISFPGSAWERTAVEALPRFRPTSSMRLLTAGGACERGI